MIPMYLFAALVVLFTAVAAAIDFRQHRIPNYVTVTAALLGLAFQLIRHGLLADGQGWLYGLGVAAGGFAVGFVLLFVPWLMGGGGMGDVKLLAALGVWFGPLYVLVAFAISMGFASVMAMSVLAWAACATGISATKDQYLQVHHGETEGGKPKSRVLPFAVPVALAAWTVVAWILVRGQL